MEVVIFDQVCPFDSNLMGTNEPTFLEMNESYLVDCPFTKQDMDFTIIAGKPLNGQADPCPLLLLRFWKNAVDIRM